MQRLKLLGLALVAVFALSAAVTAVASADNATYSILPEGTVAIPLNFEAISTEGKFETLSKKVVKCASDKATAKATSERLGTFRIEFKECEEPLLKVKCADLNHTDAEGIIVVEGEFHLRMGLTSQPLGIIAFLINPAVHFLCSIVLFVVSGCVAGEIEAGALNTLVSELGVLLKQAGGENTISSIDNDAQTAMETCALSSKQGNGTAETAGEETHEVLKSFTQGGNSVTTLIHI
jgi:hypothetical protein